MDGSPGPRLRYVRHDKTAAVIAGLKPPRIPAPSTSATIRSDSLWIWVRGTPRAVNAQPLTMLRAAKTSKAASNLAVRSLSTSDDERLLVQVTHKSLQLAPVIIMAIAAPQGAVSDCRVGDVIGETNAEQVAELCVIGKEWCREFHLSDQVRVVNRITSIIMATAEEDLPALLIHRTDSDPPTSSVSHRGGRRGHARHRGITTSPGWRTATDTRRPG
ncbi:MAG: hypothetical protein Ct9H300mP12_13730 [Acidimicrobiales bacterium]|nr:MAG: hypothetical protein Ct9H300mP12_13730 [Acidimicrobiales bacterium]